MRKAVILFNLGGPDKLENVEPFLFNLFHILLPKQTNSKVKLHASQW